MTIDLLLLIACAATIALTLWCVHITYKDCAQIAERMAEALSKELSAQHEEIFLIHRDLLQQAGRLELLEARKILPPQKLEDKLVRKIKKQIKKLS